LLELRRLELPDSHRVTFGIYTGNDLGITMIEYGSDYLLGLATFRPRSSPSEIDFGLKATRAYYGLSDALQHLGNVAFRAPVPAYKHSAAVFLHLPDVFLLRSRHSRNNRRPEWEADAARLCCRLGYDVASTEIANDFEKQQVC